MITRNFNLYLNAGHSVPLVINVNQYDSGEQWVFTLYNSDGTQYVPSTGAIVGIKSDGLGIINSGSVVDGKVVINETQQMTAAVGKAVFELLIDSQTHGTANFVVLVEEKPGNNADMSESDLSLLQEAIDATSPLPTGGSVGQVLTKTANGSAWSNAGTPTQEQVADAVSDWADEHITVSTGVVIDTSLAVAGAAADSKKVGDEITDLKSAIDNISNLETADVAVEIAQTSKYVRHADGTISGSSTYNVTEYVDVRYFAQISYRQIGIVVSSSSAGIAFYDENKVYISGIQNVGGQAEICYMPELNTVAVPDGATYVRFTTLADTATYGDFVLSGICKIVTEIGNIKSAIGNLNNLETETKTDLVSAINEAAESGGGGLDLSDLTLAATQSQTEGFSTLTLSDGTTTKSVDIPVASLDPTDTTLITNIVNAYLNNLVNGDGVSY